MIQTRCNDKFIHIILIGIFCHQLNYRCIAEYSSVIGPGIRQIGTSKKIIYFCNDSSICQSCSIDIIHINGWFMIRITVFHLRNINNNRIFAVPGKITGCYGNKTGILIRIRLLQIIQGCLTSESNGIADPVTAYICQKELHDTFINPVSHRNRKSFLAFTIDITSGSIHKMKTVFISFVLSNNRICVKCISNRSGISHTVPIIVIGIIIPGAVISFCYI